MEDYLDTFTWVFERGDDQLEIRRAAAPDAARLVVAGPSGFRTLDFPTHDALVQAQAALEDHLASDGWLLRRFSPERRQRSGSPIAPGLERRGRRRIEPAVE